MIPIHADGCFFFLSYHTHKRRRGCYIKSSDSQSFINSEGLIRARSIVYIKTDQSSCFNFGDFGGFMCIKV